MFLSLIIDFDSEIDVYKRKKYSPIAISFCILVINKYRYQILFSLTFVLFFRLHFLYSLFGSSFPYWHHYLPLSHALNAFIPSPSLLLSPSHLHLPCLYSLLSSGWCASQPADTSPWVPRCPGPRRHSPAWRRTTPR